jgi:hypothetical protein
MGRLSTVSKGQVETLYDHVNTVDCLQACGVSRAHEHMLPVQETICALADELVNWKHACKGIKERLAKAKDSQAKLGKVRRREDLKPQQLKHPAAKG